MNHTSPKKINTSLILIQATIGLLISLIVSSLLGFGGEWHNLDMKDKIISLTIWVCFFWLPAFVLLKNYSKMLFTGKVIFLIEYLVALIFFINNCIAYILADNVEQWEMSYNSKTLMISFFLSLGVGFITIIYLYKNNHNSNKSNKGV